MNKDKMKYLLKGLRKADKKLYQLYNYLTLLKDNTFDEKRWNININRICDVDEIVSDLIITLEMDLYEKEVNTNENN